MVLLIDDFLGCFFCQFSCDSVVSSVQMLDALVGSIYGCSLLCGRTYLILLG
jgi:hypothetical protein